MYSACDIFAAPSREENLANWVLEAIACGLPIIAIKVGGMIDAVVPGHTGTVLAPSDKDEMAEALGRLLKDRDRREELGRNSRIRAEHRFSLTDQARAYASLYAELDQ